MNFWWSLIFSALLSVVLAQDLPVRTELVRLNDWDLVLTGLLAYPEPLGLGRPGILVGHDFNGRDEFEDGKAIELAKLGYVAFAYDLYGKSNATFADMAVLTQDRPLHLRRVKINLDYLREVNGVDSNMLGAIGYCFGGIAVLDIARENLPGVQAVVSFHGTLDPPPTGSSDPISAKVLVCHGHADSSIGPEKVLALESEMTARQADWQVIVYGNGTEHGWTKPGSRYHPENARKTWRDMQMLFEDVLPIPRVQAADNSTTTAAAVDISTTAPTAGNSQQRLVLAPFILTWALVAYRMLQ